METLIKYMITEAELEEKGDEMDQAKKDDLKSNAEALICAAQEQALRTNYAKLMWTRVWNLHCV